MPSLEQEKSQYPHPFIHVRVYQCENQKDSWYHEFEKEKGAKL
jgi:hypothetical protein